MSKVKKSKQDVVSLYEKWAKKNKMGGGFIPFCRQDNWAGHVVKDFADFILKELSNVQG